MREIKFRAWDKKAKRWIHHEESGLLFLNFEITGGGIFHLHDETSESGRDSYDFMQYTGLKDKHGVEIYEGDVLKWEVPPVLRKLDYKTPGPDNLIYVCSWIERQCAFIFLSQHDYPHNENYFIYHVQDDLEIIGNIYENPELVDK